MSYESAVASLLELGQELAAAAPRKFDLEQMRVLAAALGHPERRFASVLIAGTNGKGSTAATLASILQAAGYRTGLYTSPHLRRPNERIRLQGESISDPEFAEIHQRVETLAQRLLAQKLLPWHPSFFEMLTAMAFEYFSSVGVEIAVLEVGMGGRLDATNIVEPAVSVITDVALDHQRFLGDTIAEIAREKAGIIRRNAPLVILPQHPQANQVIGEVCRERGAGAISAVPYMPPVSPGAGETAKAAAHGPRNRYPLSVLGKEIEVNSPLVGRHQLRNLALAMAAAVELRRFGFSVSPGEIERGVRQTNWPGRFQVIPPAGAVPEMVLDVAHNPAGAWALRATLAQIYPGRRFILVFGAMRDKAIAEMAEILFPLAEPVIATSAHSPRSATPQEIHDAAGRSHASLLSKAHVPGALAEACSLSGPAGLVVVTGSIYVVGEALESLEWPVASPTRGEPRASAQGARGGVETSAIS